MSDRISTLKGKQTMTTISDKDRADAQAVFEAFVGRPLVALSDAVVPWWLAVRDHVLAAHECPTVPEWRPTTFEEIQPGWEVRSRRCDGSEAGWGVAHRRDVDGDWRTKRGRLLTYTAAGWTYETTEPVPEPKPNPRIQVVLDWASETAGPDRHADAVDLLTRLDNLKEDEA